MKFNLYDENGYLDIKSILATDIPYIFIVGGRGIGKTYGALKEAYENDIFFMYMRRTQSQVDLVNKKEFNPFRSYSEDTGVVIEPKTFTKYNSVFQEILDEETTRDIGYTCALSTISNLRSFDASNVDLLIYDEFIAEKHERPIKYEGNAFLNAIETIGRNRELKGKKPLQVLCLANAMDLANPIFLELGLVNVAMKMRQTGRTCQYDLKRGYMLINLDITPIGRKKQDTALYRLSSGDSEFARMALENDYSFEEIGDIRSRSLKEYTPLVSCGEICIYRHKSDRLYYVSAHKSGTPVEFTSGESDRVRFRKMYGYLIVAHIHNRVEFESYECQVLFERYLKI